MNLNTFAPKPNIKKAISNLSLVKAKSIMKNRFQNTYHTNLPKLQKSLQLRQVRVINAILDTAMITEDSEKHM